MFAMNLFCYEAKQLNLKLKTWPKQLLGSLPLAFALPAYGVSSMGRNTKNFSGYSYKHHWLGMLP
jgi:DNA phosphorothioation-dependent restriction protein DptG